MKKISIVEFEKNHYRGIITLLKVIEKFYKDKYEVSLFINDLVLKNIENALKNINLEIKTFVFNQTKRDIFYYIRKLIFFIKLSLYKSDITYINTLEPIAKFIFFLRPKGRKIYNFHHIEYLERDKRILRDEIMYKIVRKNNEFSTLTKYQKEHLQRIFPNSEISIVPDGYYKDKKTSYLTHKDKVIFSIPGVISVARKDYKTVFEVLSEIEKDKYQLVLLGTFSKKEMYEETRKLIEEYKDKVNMKFFNHYLSDEEMENGILESDIIIAPSVEGEYGKTKITGAFFYVIEYGKVGIFPRIFNFQQIRHSILYYSTKDELKDLIRKIIEDKEYLNNIKIKAEEEIKSLFSLDKIKEDIIFLKH